MTRNRFDIIHRFLHFSDNSEIDQTDRVFKVRPLIDYVNNKFQEFAQPLGSKYSLDEAMEPYYGRHSMKQFIRGKPIRFGFKFWCLATPEGYLLKFSPYTGKKDRIQGESLGSSVVQSICIGFIPVNSFVFIDNYFNSLELLNTMLQHNLNVIGTIRADRTGNAPLKDLGKQSRGATHTLQSKDKKVTLIKWQDNNQVTMGTNVQDENVTLAYGTCQRWNASEKKRVAVTQPTIIKHYNKYMGGC